VLPDMLVKLIHLHLLVLVLHAPGVMRDLMHKLSSLDHYGKLCQWFCMPLAKVEALTKILINCGYIDPPRMHCCRAESHECSELLVMSVLYILGTGAAFWSCKALCGISTSKVCIFFHFFLDTMVDMKDEYISLPCNMTKLNTVSKN
jgi:hypothetical protein